MSSDPQVEGGGTAVLTEPREASGLTTRLVLTFVEREGGRAAVEEVLGRCGLTDREDELRDENAWFPDRTRIDLFEAAAATLGDPDIARRIGASAIDLNVGQPLKLSLRALGSPRLIYSNIGRASGKFNRVHRMDVLHCGTTSARIRNVPIGDATHHPCDCGYNMGLLSCVPLVFGEPQARVRHPRCIGNGDPECIYEVEWSALDRPAIMTAVVAAALIALAVAAIALPGLLPVATAVAGAIALFAAARVIADRRRRWRLLQSQLSGQAEATDLMVKSMQDLVSALQLDDVLSKVTANAQSAVGGADFALLVAEPEGLRARSSSDLPARTVATLEAWGSANTNLLRDPVLIDDLTTVPELAGLPLDHTVPLGSLCASPLVYRGRSLGVLVALSTADSPFFPRDIDLLSSYAAQAAIALTNARLFEAQQELAIQDPLTGLFNHRHFHETLGRELDRCRRHGGELGLAVFDLDGFKGVNDTGGHAEGDEVLRRVADALRSTCRSSDLPFRVGGDEFALVLPSSGPAATLRVAERACEVIDRIDERTTISFGVASWPDAGPTKDALLDRADRSLYRMKRAADPEDETVGAIDTRQLSKHERLACASRVAVKLAPLLDEAEISRTAVAELQETFGYHRVAVHRSYESGLIPVAAAGRGGLPDRATTEAGSPGRAARSGEAVLVADAPSREAGSELAMPIRVDGEPWGVLELAHHEPGGFDFDDLLFADTIGAAIGAALHRCQLYAELEGTFMRTLAVLSDALEAKDSYTAAHAREVADLSVRTAGALGVGGDDLRTLRYGALLHDIGKIAIRSEILHKPGPLTDDEYEEIKEHTIVGAKMLERIPYFADVHPLVRSSHERWDGAGYPDELAFEEIPLGARVIAACDAFHAMTSDRPYRAAMDRAEAIAELRRCSGSQFDPSVIDALIGLLDATPRAPREAAAAR
ncbi:MAG: diguanylate cyclase [Solirubrobacterales bacterium]